MPDLRTKSFAFPFPVADTEEGPRFTWDSFTLTLEFVDYLGISREVHFTGVSHYELLSEDELDSKVFQYDGAVEVLDSPLVDRLIEIGEITADERRSFRHLVIGFNEIGSYLVVVYRSLDTTKAEHDAGHQDLTRAQSKPQ